MNEKNEAVLWTCDRDAEWISSHTPDEAIEQYLDRMEDEEEVVYDTIMVYGYARLEVNKEVFKNVVRERAQEYIDENYGGEDGHEINAETEEALEKFISTYLKNYIPWQCKEVTSQKIIVDQWIEKHRPDWKKEGVK